MKEFDSLGFFTRWSFNDDETYYQNEYDSHGQLLRRIIIDDVDTADTISFFYDSVGRLIERRSKDYLYQWDYDSDGRMVEYRYTDVILDSVLVLEKYEFDKEGVLQKKESFDNRKEGNGNLYCEYDSKGNVVFKRRENIGYSRVVERRTKYKYDRNDSIIKETTKETQRWHTYKNRWQELDSTGQVVDYVNYEVVPAGYKKEKIKYERVIKRNAQGYPVKERFVQRDNFGKSVSLIDYDEFGRVTKYEHFHNDENVPYQVIKLKYDELGREIEKENIDNRHSQFHKQVWRYYKDTDFCSYYATYGGENYDFSHESLFFFDEHGNCIAHIQWMPGADLYEYYFEVFRYEYYE
jgi:YD repeat-containing protein